MRTWLGRAKSLVGIKLWERGVVENNKALLDLGIYAEVKSLSNFLTQTKQKKKKSCNFCFNVLSITIQHNKTGYDSPNK